MKKWWILGGILAVILWLAGSFIGTYNSFVQLENNIEGQWAQVENQLQRRNDLIPNLVNVVKGYAKHEKDIFTGIADARARLAGAKSVNEKVSASNQLSSALARLLVIVENYPVLKADRNFLALQDQLEGTENRLAVERQRFNDLVKIYNTKRRTFPTGMIAGMFGFDSKKEYIQVPESKKEVPKVEF